MTILEKAEQFFDLKKKKQQKKIEKLKKIIYQLKVKAAIVKRDMIDESDTGEKEKLEQEYRAVKRFIAKGRRRLIRLKAIKKAL